MQNTLPEVGKTYTSQADPSFKIYVEKVDLIEADGDEPESFCVEGCDPKDIGNEAGDGVEIYGDEWIADGYHLATPR